LSAPKEEGRGVSLIPGSKTLTNRLYARRQSVLAILFRKDKANAGISRILVSVFHHCIVRERFRLEAEAAIMKNTNATSREFSARDQARCPLFYYLPNRIGRILRMLAGETVV